MQMTLEGEVRIGDRLLVPLCDEMEFIGTVMGILHQNDFLRIYESASFKYEPETIGIGVWRSGCHEYRDILCGLATNVED
jgi:hypothetical protein